LPVIMQSALIMRGVVTRRAVDNAAARHTVHSARRRETLETTHGWRVLAVGKGEVLGPSLALERAVGELLSLEPRIGRRSR
jgi:hypothetical protein